VLPACETATPGPAAAAAGRRRLPGKTGVPAAAAAALRQARGDRALRVGGGGGRSRGLPEQQPASGSPFARSTGSTDLRSFPAGLHGGALYCGDGTLNGVTGITCGWAEKVRVGFVFYLRGSASSLSGAASETSQVRAAIEP
jgi:hypothetical protein